MCGLHTLWDGILFDDAQHGSAIFQAGQNAQRISPPCEKFPLFQWATFLVRHLLVKSCSL